MGGSDDIKVDGEQVREQVKPVMEAAAAVPSMNEITPFGGPCAPVVGMCTSDCTGGGGCQHSAQIFSAYLENVLKKLAADAQHMRARAESLVKATKGAVRDLESVDQDTAAALKTYLEGVDSTSSATASTAAGAAAAFRKATGGANAQRLA